MKAQIIHAFAGDSISLQITIYNDVFGEFDPNDFSITAATLHVSGLENGIDGVITGNVVSFFMQAGVLELPGKFNYYAQITGGTACFTIAYGCIIMSSLPL